MLSTARPSLLAAVAGYFRLAVGLLPATALAFGDFAGVALPLVVAATVEAFLAVAAAMLLLFLPYTEVVDGLLFHLKAPRPSLGRGAFAR